MQSNNYKHITADGTYDITNYTCTLERIKVNFADSAGTIKVTETNINTIIANKIDLTKVVDHEFNLSNLNGLKIVVASSSAPDITVIWR
jgi:hypothetical protein